MSISKQILTLIVYGCLKVSAMPAIAPGINRGPAADQFNKLDKDENFKEATQQRHKS